MEKIFELLLLFEKNVEGLEIQVKKILIDLLHGLSDF